MTVSSIAKLCEHCPDWSERWTLFERANSLSEKVCRALQLGLLLARLRVEADLTQQAQRPHPWLECPHCGHRLRSKGFRYCKMTTLIGVVR